MVSFQENRLLTDLYIKPTDTHQYLHYTPSHSYHTKKSIIYNQTLRLSGICSKESDFVNHKIEMVSWFLKRIYLESFIKTEIEKLNLERD